MRHMNGAVTQVTSARRRLSPTKAALVPCLFAALLAAFVLVPPVRGNEGLNRTFLLAAAVLIAWALVLFIRARAGQRTLTLELAVRRHHWVQACAQGAVFFWWGRYVDQVYAFAPFIVAQLVFAYGVDALLQWSRRENYQLGFGPFPIIFSINLFLWFKPEWFHWQFAMILLGYLGKELIRWTKDGRSAHIFNPSSFPLGVCSLVLIATGMTEITWGQEIAQSQYNPPYIYAVIFLASIPGQLLFGVAMMTVWAVVSAYTFGLGYFWITGTYFFHDAYIPIAVFLGMHLLFTDPSTSPSTGRGRIVFGILYGFALIAFAVLLRAIGVPAFYDKLLPVPILNLLVQVIDRGAASRWFGFLDFSWISKGLTPIKRRYGFVGIWVGIFVVLSWTGGLGDNHPGQYLPFWQQACDESSDRGCDYLAFMQDTYCESDSGWACNELGILFANGDRFSEAQESWASGCDLGFDLACENLTQLRTGAPGFGRAPPPLEELPIVLRGSKGPVTERTPEALYALACKRGWPDTCEVPPGDSERP